MKQVDIKKVYSDMESFQNAPGDRQLKERMMLNIICNALEVNGDFATLLNYEGKERKISPHLLRHAEPHRLRCGVFCAMAYELDGYREDFEGASVLLPESYATGAVKDFKKTVVPQRRGRPSLDHEAIRCIHEEIYASQQLPSWKERVNAISERLGKNISESTLRRVLAKR